MSIHCSLQLKRSADIKVFETIIKTKYLVASNTYIAHRPGRHTVDRSYRNFQRGSSLPRGVQSQGERCSSLQNWLSEWSSTFLQSSPCFLRWFHRCLRCICFCLPIVSFTLINGFIYQYIYLKSINVSQCYMFLIRECGIR